MSSFFVPTSSLRCLLYKMRHLHAHSARPTFLSSAKDVIASLDIAPRQQRHQISLLRASGARAGSGGSGGGGTASFSSNVQSELVTRMVLGLAGALCGAGVPPGAVAAFSTAANSGTAAASEQEPTCTRCRIEPLTGEAAEQLSDLLLGFGAQSVVLEEYRAPGAAEQEVFGSESGLWDSCSLVAHFPLEHDADSTLAAAWDIMHGDDSGGDDGQGESGGGGRRCGWQYVLEPVVNAEWVEQIKASYVPLRINNGLYIVPTWSEPEDPSALNIILEPGVAFGTGEHPTTRLCLGHLWSLREQLPGTRLVDYGSGSGVLGIAALMMGAEQAVGTDTDPLAVKAAARNARLNGRQGGFVSLQCSPDLGGPEPLGEAGLPSKGCYDMVVANILRGPLLELQPRLTGYVRPGGRLALSGILAEQVPDVRAAYERHFTDFAVQTDGSWALVTAIRR